MKHQLKHADFSNVRVESRGVGRWHVGEQADPRMCAAGNARGYFIQSLAQQFQSDDFEEFDLVLASDQSVLSQLRSMKESGDKQIELMTFASSRYKLQEVPDPYYGGSSGFDEVITILEDSCRGIIHLIKNPS